MHWNQKNYNFLFLLPVTKFCPLAKNCPDPKFLPKFFYSLDPLYQNLKSKLGNILLHAGVTPATGLIPKKIYIIKNKIWES